MNPTCRKDKLCCHKHTNTESSGYGGELQGSDYGHILLNRRLAGATVASASHPQRACATQAAHNCIPACVSCERPRDCSGKLQGSNHGIHNTAFTTFTGSK